MRNINKEIEMKYSQIDAIHIHAFDLLSEGKLEAAKLWMDIWDDILNDIELLTLIKQNISIVQIKIDEIYLN